MNIQFIVLTKALSGPLFGLSINVLYCDSATPYHIGSQCYSPEHLFFCLLAGIILASVAYAELIASLLYFVRNPFESGCFGHPNRNYMLSKGCLKLLFPTYFVLNASLKLEFLFIVLSPVLWGVYIFFHRLNTNHSFNLRHFYVEYFF